LFTVANTTGATLGTIDEGSFSTAEEFIAEFDGRMRFSTYRAISQSPKSNAKIAVAKDPNVPRSRFLTFSAQDTTSGDIKKAVEWRRSKQLAEALTISIPVEGWTAPNGEIWQENRN